MSGKLLLITGLSGSGKTTMVNSALASLSNLSYLKTFTTRPPRNDEEMIGGVEYDFVSISDYEIMRKKSEMWDHSEIHGNYYGVDIPNVIERIINGENIICNVYPRADLIEEMRRMYRVSSFLVCINIPKQQSEIILNSERPPIEAERYTVESELPIQKIIEISDQVFEPTLELETDREAFVHMLSLLIG